MLYKSTRGKEKKIYSSDAIVKGLAEDGGLYVPVEIPVIDQPLNELKDKNYLEIAYEVMSKFFDDFDKNSLLECVERAYDHKFDKKEIVDIKEINDAYFLELYHGPTIAFKDMALSILPHLLKTACKKLNFNKEVVILTATSGDTGKAALEGFADVEGTKIIVFYPKDGVSPIQERQMTTQEGKNTFVVSIDGNFDDAQRGVKEIFSDENMNKLLEENNYVFSSANSINIGRLVPQVVYYVYSYLQLLKNEEIKDGEKINVVVPTGNFGNILAGYYAKQMGLPIDQLICASNENNVLCDFFNTGVYDRRRDFKVTNSPSMDILVSSNLERLLYEISGKNEDAVKYLMEKLNTDGEYEITNEMKNNMRDFHAGFATEKDTQGIINKVYKESNYLMDTHTAVAYSVYKKYKEETKDNTKTIIVSTASPFKFTRSVIESIGEKFESMDDFELMKELSKMSKVDIPNAVNDLDKREILHNNVCSKGEMRDVIKELLGVRK